MTAGSRRNAHPRDGDTKPCPMCHGMLVFNRHCAVLAVGMAPRPGSEPRERLRYEPAWVCRKGGCDYRELVGELF